MERLGFPQNMGGKDKYFRVRSDEELKAALKKAAELADRKEADQARYLLRVALGLLDEELNARELKKRIEKAIGRPIKPIKGGTA